MEVTDNSMAAERLIEVKRIMKDLSYYQKLYIYGGGSRARSVYGYLKKCMPSCVVTGFLVSNRKDNPERLFDLPVYSEEDREELDKTLPVLIAARALNQKEILTWLKRLGFFDLIPVTPELENEFRINYVEKRFLEEGKEFLFLRDCSRTILSESPFQLQRADSVARIYMVRNVHDKGVGRSAEELESYPWIVPIQAGAAITCSRLCELTDDEGDNISPKNPYYCELTAIYWLWKHAKDFVHTPYIGICHYRRHFLISGEEIERLGLSDIDVVMPVPTTGFPSVEADYMARHGRKEWDLMLEVLEEKEPEYFPMAKEILRREFYFGCNMYVMKQEIFQNFCGWMFPILEEIENRRKDKDQPPKRYIGFLSERMTGIYFARYEKKWRIAYAQKLFIG